MEQSYLQNEYYREFGEFLPGGFFVYKADASAELIYANSTCAELFGCKDVEEFYQHVHGTFKGMVHEDDYLRVCREIKKQVADSNWYLDHVFYRIRRKDNEIHWMDDFGRFHQDTKYGPIYLVLIHDITELMNTNGMSCGIDFMLHSYSSRTAVKAHPEKEDVQILLDDCRKALNIDCIYILEALATSDGYEITYESVVDEKYKKLGTIRRCSREEFELGKRNYNEKGLYQYKVNVSGDQCAVLSYGNFHGDIYDGSVSFTEFDKPGKEWSDEEMASVAKIGRVLHQVILLSRLEKVEKERLKEMQKHIEARKEAEQANAAKSTFLCNMSHDIRTPMNALSGFTRLTKMNLDNKEKCLEYLDKLDVTVKHITNLINNILTMSKIESNKVELNDDTVNVIEEVKAQEIVFRSAMEQRHIDFVINIDVNHENIIIDRVCVKQIIMNLLSNALKYTTSGGKVTYSVTEKEYEAGYVTLEFSVKDTGIGMSEEFQKNMFDMFERERTDEVLSIQGTGLGLAIVKKYAEILNGDLTCKSKTGVGTEFIFSIKCKVYTDHPIEKNEEKKVDTSIIRGLRILLTEDNSVNAEIAKEILEEFGAVVEIATNGRKCIDLLTENEADYFDLILMDIQMPYMDGYAATKEIRKMKNKKKANIPIIAMTANAFEEDRRRSFEVGMDDHITKPLDLDVFISKISEVFLKKR